MYDKELIQKVCDLTCTKADVARESTTIKYDTEHPFRKYYSFATIKGAIEKYLSNAWDDRTLTGWACKYCWILSGGFEDNIIDDLNSFERFFSDFLTWDLDGLSFFSAEYQEENEIEEVLARFAHYDHIWQTRTEWEVVYAMIGPCAEVNEDQYALLVNKTRKEYMIMYSDHLENGYEDAYIHFVSQDAYIALVEQLKADGYTMLPRSEEYYYMTINNL